MQSSLFNDTSESDISDLKNSVRDFKRNHHMNSNIKNYTCEKNDLCTDDEIESVSTEVQKFITKMSKLKHRLLNFSERNQIFTVNKIFTDDERKTMRKFWEIGEPSDEEKPTRHVNLNWKGTTVRFVLPFAMPFNILLDPDATEIACRFKIKLELDEEIEWVFRGCGECDGDRCYQTWRRHQLLKAMQISIFYTRDDIICNAMLRKNNLNTSIIMEFLYSDDQVYVLVEIVEKIQVIDYYLKLQEISRKFHNYTPSNEVPLIANVRKSKETKTRSL
ncbi:hypothetical protein GLOIN_2v1772943 [Rhizophagus irregularis DAOM 181602=DAOM 197198]|nr:hypothetical protein GLOIN_2v1772943 [Rhizophagus irregularis DAOM 181602=DAOM 197198]